MQPLDRRRSRESDSPERAGKAGTRPSAEIIWLDEWRRRHRRQGFRWRRPPPKSAPFAPLQQDDPPSPITPSRRSAVPMEAWLMMLVVFSAFAGAVFALMGLGYLP